MEDRFKPKFPNGSYIEGKIFPNGSFWTATVKGAASYTWRSIISARKVLERGVRWYPRL